MADKISFAMRIGENDEIDLAAFDRAAKDREIGREELVRVLMRAFLARQDSPEQYYTIKGYGGDHKIYADIHNMAGLVQWHQVGFVYDTPEWRALEHAIHLAERGDKGDKEEVIALLQSIFGERNVFVKEED